MARKILTIGATGMLGHKLMQRLSPGFEVLGTMRERKNTYPALAGLKIATGVDATDLDAVNRVMDDFKPDAVINCVGIIKQLEESKSAEPTIQINALLPHQLARLSTAHGAKFIHVSTDCVFSGTAGRPYTEADRSDAHDLYGQSKFMGEVIQAPHLTLRTSIIGPELRGKKSLVEWVLSQKGREVKGFARALYTGLTTLEMAKVLENVLNNHMDMTGLYHLSVDSISKFDLIALMNEIYNLEIILHKDEDFFCDRRLDSARFRAVTGYVPPSWPQLIQEMAADRT